MKNVISSSRRTDIPAFHLSWLIECLKQGYADVLSPYGKRYRVSLKNEDVHSIVLWSKDFSQFLNRKDAFKDYNLFFNFTINHSALLEPHMPSLEQRLSQVKILSQLFGPECINWRFDPIVFLNEGKDHNLFSFQKIVKHMYSLGVKRCIFSFCQYYPKVKRRFKKHGIEFYEPSFEEKQNTLQLLANFAQKYQITLYSCCQDMICHPNIKKASCIDGYLLTQLFGEPASKAKDPSQRPGCLCTKSKEVGSYTLKCFHDCLYCYAMP